MIARRRALLALIPLLVAAAPETARDFIRRAGDELAAILARPASPAARAQAIGAFLDRVVAIPDLARFCLGRFWRRATTAERARYLALFRLILVANVLARVGAYRHPAPGGFAVKILRPIPNGGDIDVTTEVIRPGLPAARVTWIVRMSAGGPRIVDLIAEGTSLRITVRADYAAFLEQHRDSIPALLTAMARQTGQSRAEPHR